VYFGKDGSNKPCIKRFISEIADRGVVLTTTWHYSEVGENRIAMQEAKEFVGQDAFATPKPEALIRRVLQIATQEGDWVLDSFLGSGTTAAVAHKMGRRWIGIEMGEHARTHCLPRLKKVIEGEQGGISQAVAWQGGGGFRFFRIGEPAFGADGRINPAIRFSPLASYLWFLESGAPHPTGRFDSPLLGERNGVAYLLLYNGILGDRRPESGNVLNQAVWRAVLDCLPAHDGPRVIYGEACRLSPTRLKSLGVTFKQIPYDIRMR
jgi:adenine-specific DNA-methyltransferase